MKFTEEHEEIRRTLKRFIDTEINPYVDEWEEAGIFPAHEVFKKLGDLPVELIGKTIGETSVDRFVTEVEAARQATKKRK